MVKSDRDSHFYKRKGHFLKKTKVHGLQLKEGFFFDYSKAVF